MMQGRFPSNALPLTGTSYYSTIHQQHLGSATSQSYSNWVLTLKLLNLKLSELHQCLRYLWLNRSNGITILSLCPSICGHALISYLWIELTRKCTMLQICMKGSRRPSYMRVRHWHQSVGSKTPLWLPDYFWTCRQETGNPSPPQSTEQAPTIVQPGNQPMTTMSVQGRSVGPADKDWTPPKEYLDLFASLPISCRVWGCWVPVQNAYC